MDTSLASCHTLGMETIDGVKPMRPVRVEDVPVEKGRTLREFVQQAVPGATFVVVYQSLADSLGFLWSTAIALASAIVVAVLFRFARRRFDRWRAARTAADVTVQASAANPAYTDRPAD
ncbi:hypothetical protein EDF46_0683 [Frondihabitans sp. PhB188]|nr:hypothetical protein EDF46_0683 [Frondihabitans sp. PhB188]